MISILFSSPITFFLLAGALVISISIHEFAHAYVADKLGDPTAKLMGRITLNPKAHLDPMGTLLLLFVGFGWGKPVPFDARNLTNPKRDAAIISFAGPFSNVILALLLSLAFHLSGGNGFIGDFLRLAVYFNLVLAIFNLIPIHPLDGFKVVNGLLPRELSYQWLQMAPYGMWILLFVIFTGVTDKIIGPILSNSLRILGF